MEKLQTQLSIIIKVFEKYKDKVAQMREKIISHRDEWEEQSHPWGVDFWKRF